MAQDDNNQTDIKRYEAVFRGPYDMGYIEHQEEPDGGWCKWEDVQKLLKTIETQRERIIKLQTP